MALYHNLDYVLADVMDVTLYGCNDQMSLGCLCIGRTELLGDDGERQFCGLGRTDQLRHEYLVARKLGTYVTQCGNQYLVDDTVLTHVGQLTLQTILDAVLQTQ